MSAPVSSQEFLYLNLSVCLSVDFSVVTYVLPSEVTEKSTLVWLL